LPSPFGNSNLKNFFLGSGKGRELRDTKRLYEEARAVWGRLPVGSAEARNEFLVDIVFDICGRPDRFPGRALLYAVADLVYDLFAVDGLAQPPSVTSFENLSIEEGVALRDRLYRIIRLAGDWERLSAIWKDKIAFVGKGILEYLPHSAFAEDAEGLEADEPLGLLSVPLIDLCENPAEVIYRTMATFHDPDVVGAKLYEALREQFERNLCGASGIDYERRLESSRQPVYPEDYDAKSNSDLVDAYLSGTPFASFFQAPVPFAIPFPARFEHTHLIGGSGHGKTQLMQGMIYHDLLKAQEDGRSVIVIDSQGDLLRTISSLSLFDPAEEGSLGERLLMVDPTDVEWPVCLNLFDWNRERLRGYGALEREKLLNSAVELYEYLFGALLGAELTQRQGLIFKYLARLMMEIPDSTIQTLRELMEDGEPYRPYMERLPGSANSFFATRFFDRSFNETKKQILTRLWGVLSNATLERMFSHPRNKVDLFEAMNEGKIVLINTAKDLLKQDGCAIFGRFFVALIVQAAMERSSIAPHKRNPAFVYIDEAQDYLDDNIGQLLNQARKYRIGMTLAHQNLDQLSVSLRSSIFASTSIKFAGGVSAKDARVLGDEMRCDDDLLLHTKKRQTHTEFACYVRNLTPQAVKVTVPLGTVEETPKLSRASYQALIDANRAAYAVRAGEFSLPSPTPVPPRPSPLPPVHARGAAVEAPPVQPVKTQEVAEPPPPVRSEGAPPRPLRQKVDTPRTAAKRPPPSPPPLGRGGRQHKYLQELIKKAAEDRGFRVVIEESILDGAGRVDVALSKGKRRIACEISVTTCAEHELQNVEKCIAAGYSEVILAVADERQRKSLKAFMEGNLDEKAIQAVRYFLPEEVLAYLDGEGAADEAAEQVVRGYRVKVTQTTIDPLEAQARREGIAGVIAQSLKRARRAPI
jgi:hypothetical protein